MNPSAPALASPEQLGFGPKFQQWYQDQLDAIDRIVGSKKRFVALVMPTGAGKSLTAVAAARLHPDVERACYLTSTKGLQDQLKADFEPVGLYDLRGQRNYPCLACKDGGELAEYRGGRWDIRCDEGPCHSGVSCSMAPPRRGEAPRRPDCRYYGSVWDAQRTALVSTNYAMYLSAQEYGQGLGKFDFLILDEAHDTDKQLEEFLAISANEHDAHRLGSKYMHANIDPTEWRDWARYHRPFLKTRLETFPAPRNASDARELRSLKDLHGRLERLATINPLDWVVEHNSRSQRLPSVHFAPVRVAAYAEQYLFRQIKHVVLLSATMTRKTATMLGVPPDQMDFWECPSRFPVARRPIISINTVPYVRVDARMSESDKQCWLRRIDNLIAPRRALGRKGMIETVSYDRMKYLLAHSEHKDLFVTHDSARSTQDAITTFRKTRAPLILVSPSVVTGYDFPDDQCRYIIVAKVPQVDTRPLLMKARIAIDKEYTGYVAMQKLVQGCGRGMRHAGDWCEVLIVDDHFADWFLDRYRKHAPKWWYAAIEYTEVYPEPLQVL